MSRADAVIPTAIQTKTATNLKKGVAGAGWLAGWQGVLAHADLNNWDCKVNVRRIVKDGSFPPPASNVASVLGSVSWLHTSKSHTSVVLEPLSVMCVNLGVYTYRQASPPSTSSIRGIAKQLVTMVAVFCAPISNHFTDGGGLSPVPAADPSQLTSGEMADQDGSDASPPESQASYSQYKSEDGRAGSAGSGQTYTPTPSRTTTSNSPSNNAATKTDSLLFNKIDERQRLARERRGEREKQNAIKEAQWQAREERARQYYERQLEERKRRLEEQRVKEDKRRAAVEEKRRQKLEDDKARHEAVIRRTLERSQRTRQKTNRWSWGGVLQTNTPSTPADADRRSVSTMNLSKHIDPVITKRLSSSSATLLHSPDRGLRRLPLTPWESNVVNRLQQPTHSYLARSRSAMSLSGEQTVSCHPMGSMSFKALQAQPLPHCRSHDRNLSRETVSSSTKTARRKTTGTTQ
ncbi:Ensconsin, partial [Larimichthys crocea]